MRTIKELLIILRDELPNIIQREGCLCFAAASLQNDNVINIEEYRLLSDYIWSNKPAEAEFLYWWPFTKLEPRMEFLDKLIAEL